MKIRSLTIVVSGLGAALTVALCSAGPSAAGAPGAGSAERAGASSQQTVAPGAGKDACFRQLGDASQVGVVSQRFGSDGYPFDVQGADDFTLHRRCAVSTIGIDGMAYNGVASSYAVTFYQDKGGHPGRVISTTTSNQFGVCPSGVACDIAITLPTAVMLKKGTGWVSVQATVDFGAEFVWVTGLTQSGRPARWQNPGDGWGTGCVTWTPLQSCWASLDPGPDFEFVLLR